MAKAKKGTTTKIIVKWSKKESALIIDCLRYAQRGDFTSKKEADLLDGVCERINLGDTYTISNP